MASVSFEAMSKVQPRWPNSWELTWQTIYWHVELVRFYAKSLPVADSLAGVSVLVTRPVHQAQNLCQLIESRGGEAFRFPTLEIVAPLHPERVESVISQLPRFDIAIFISPNAVERGMQLIDLSGGLPLPAHLKIAAVGVGSASRLTDRNVKVDIFPSNVFNSEALLELPALQSIAGKHIVIFRGEGGREILAEKLRERGAFVEYAECYRRAQPKANLTYIDTWLNSNKRLIVTITSNEALQNLLAMLHDVQRQRLLKLPLIVVSERNLQLAKQLGFIQVIMAKQASDQALLAAALDWTSATLT